MTTLARLLFLFLALVPVFAAGCSCDAFPETFPSAARHGEFGFVVS